MSATPPAPAPAARPRPAAAWLAFSAKMTAVLEVLRAALISESRSLSSWSRVSFTSSAQRSSLSTSS